MILLMKPTCPAPPCSELSLRAQAQRSTVSFCWSVILKQRWMSIQMLSAFWNQISISRKLTQNDDPSFSSKSKTKKSRCGLGLPDLVDSNTLEVSARVTTWASNLSHPQIRGCVCLRLEWSENILKYTRKPCRILDVLLEWKNSIQGYSGKKQISLQFQFESLSHQKRKRMVLYRILWKRVGTKAKNRPHKRTPQIYEGIDMV